VSRLFLLAWFLPDVGAGQASNMARVWLVKWSAPGGAAKPKDLRTPYDLRTAYDLRLI
jgi:hypothetical protein